MYETGKDQNMKLSQDLKAANERAPFLQKDIDTIELEKHQLKESNVALSQKIETLGRKLSGMEELTKHLVKKCNGLLTQFNTEREATAIQKKLFSKEKELNEILKENVRQLGAEVQSLTKNQEEVTICKKKYEDVKKAKDSSELDYHRSKNALMKDMENIMRGKIRAQDITTKLELLVQKLEHLLLKKKKEVCCLKGEMKVMAGKFKDSYQNHNGARKKELSVAQEKSKELGVELGVLRGQLQEFMKKYESQRASAIALTEKNTLLENTIKEQVKIIDDLASQNAGTEEALVERIKEEPENLELECLTPTQLDHVKRTLSEMRDKNAALFSDNSLLREQINILMKKSSTEMASSTSTPSSMSKSRIKVIPFSNGLIKDKKE